MTFLESLRSLFERLRARWKAALLAFLKWPAIWRGGLLFGAALLVFNGLGAASYLSFRWYAESSRKIPQSQGLVDAVTELTGLVQKARDLGQEYLLVGRNKDLRNYQATLQKANASLAKLKILAADFPEHRAALESLSSLTNSQLPLSEQLAALRKAKVPGVLVLGMRIQSAGMGDGRSLALAVVKAKEEENYTKILGLFQGIRDTQKGLVARWKAEVRTANWVFLASIIFGNLLAIALLGWAGHALAYHMARGETASKALAHTQHFVDSTAEAIFGIDLEGNCVFCNRACLRLLGYEDASELLGRSMKGTIFLSRAQEGIESAPGSELLLALKEGRGLHLEDVQVWRADGGGLAVECWLSVVQEEGHAVGAAITLHDITRAKAAREDLRRANETLQTQVHDLAQHSREMTLFGQLNELLQACNSTQELCKVVSLFAKELFPLDSGALQVLDPSAKTMVPQASWGEAQDFGSFEPHDCWAIRRGKPHYEQDPIEGLFCTHVPKPYPAFSFCLPLTAQGGTLGVLHLRGGSEGARMSESRQLLAVALAQQVALGLSNLKLREILREDAIRDPLTGLFNRRYMKESLEHEVQRGLRGGSSIGVVTFDLDHFKEVNDSLGHGAGDALLQALGALVKESLRAEDIPCRQGGDEFLVILPGIPEAEAVALAEGLRLKVSLLAREQLPGLSQKITLSVGLAMFPQDGASSADLQRAADKALYEAKAAGRNRVVTASHLRGQTAAENL